MVQLFTEPSSIMIVRQPKLEYMVAKTYELIFLPSTFSLLGAKDESECARRVAIWHIDKMILGTVAFKINFLKLKDLFLKIIRLIS